MIEFGRKLAEEQGMQFKIFCSFSCTNEALGTMLMITGDGEKINLPICDYHRDLTLDT